MTENETPDVEIDDIGTILKSSRLKQKKEIESISNELCIRKIYLTALEEGDYETLPPIPYGIGYVRTYARYLGLNPERAVKLYKAASQEEDSREEETEKTPEVNKSNHWHILASVLVLALIYGGWSWYAGYYKEETPQSVPEETVVQEEITASVEEIEDIEETPVEEMAAKEEETPVEEVVEEQEETEQVAENETSAYPEDKVVVEFTGESWVELKDKNKIYIQGVYHKDDRREIPYTDNLFISAGRPENVKVYVKGTEKDLLAKRRKTNIPLDSLN